ncbi:acyl carrier protein [Jatrophihabitans sp. DSM 45814]
MQFKQVKDVIVEILGIEDRADDFEPSTPLLGSVAELDSMAVIELVVALEHRFGIEVDDSEMTGDLFETFGSLADFVVSHQA